MTTSCSSQSFPPDRYNLLIEFAHKHLVFQRAELESVLDMYGIALDGPDCSVLPLPNQVSSEAFDSNEEKKKGDTVEEDSKADKQQESIQCRRPFLILSFPLNAIGRLFQLDDDSDNNGTENPESKDSCPKISTILSRCTLIRSVVELWGVGTTIESCAAATKTWVNDCPTGRTMFERHSQPSQTWKITIHTLGSTFSREEQEAMRAQFSYLKFKGKVQMKKPSNEFILIREIELDDMGSPRYPRHGLKKVLIPENDARPPLAVYFGRVLGGVRSLKGRGGVHQYSLKKRSYLGPTSMDAELSLIMTNLGQVGKASFCFDPFVGTGSILLTCALRGAYCFGTDIDLRVLRGRGVEENILANFRQFDLVRPELVRSDNAIYHRHYRSNVPLYDAIVCDPPYGVRAGARKTGSRRDDPRPILDEHRHDHIAQTKPYAVSDVMSDLLDTAARSLVPGGRLVYIIPSMSDFDAATDLPRHECLELVHVCYQPLSLELGRRMVTMKKTQDYDLQKRESYLANVWINGPESAEKCANIREKLIEAAKKKPGYEEKAALRKQKRKAQKEAKKKAKLRTTESTDASLDR